MKHLSLFTGSGIGDYAAEQCGIVTAAQCECEPACCYCLEKMFPRARLFRDVHDVSATTLREFMPIDIISGGFPCQNLSTAGRGEGIEGSRSGLWREMFRVIRQVRPTWLLIENVPAIKLRGVDRVIAPLERIGYTCWPLVVGAWSVGAPHKRDRVWIVGRLENTTKARRTDAGEESPNCERQDTNSWGRINKCQSGVAGGTELENTSDNRCWNTTREVDGSGWNGTEDRTQDVSGRQRREANQSNAISWASGRDSQLEHAIGEHCRCGSNEPEWQPKGRIVTRWPSRPGEPQHDWEAPRLAQFGVGDAVDGLAGRVRSRANKALLRMAGNGWVYPLAKMIYQWIAEQDQVPR